MKNLAVFLIVLFGFEAFVFSSFLEHFWMLAGIILVNIGFGLFMFTKIQHEEAGIIYRIKSFWIGLHYSDYNKRYCLNIIPGITIWWIARGGNRPHEIL